MFILKEKVTRIFFVITPSPKFQLLIKSAFYPNKLVPKEVQNLASAAAILKQILGGQAGLGR